MRGLGTVLCASLAAAVGLVVPSALAAQPLPLEPTPSEPTGRAPRLPTVFDARYVVDRASESAPIRLRDDLTGRLYEPALPRGCGASGLRFPELLAYCRDTAPAGPRVINLGTGQQQTFPGDADDRYDIGPFQPDQLGWEEADNYHDLGSRWLAGSWSEDTAKLPVGGAVYLDRQTGRRVTRPRGPQFDLASPGLAPARPACAGPGRSGGGLFPRVDAAARAWLRARPERRGAGIDMVLERCGRPARLVSRCPSGCADPTLTRRFVTWTSFLGFHVRSRRTGRSYSLRLPRIDAQRTLTAITDRRAIVAFFRFARRQPDDGYRVTEIALPRSIR